MGPESDYSNYPRSFEIHGRRFVLTSENRWLRRFASADGAWHVCSRILDGSFEMSLLSNVDASSLTPLEREEAGLAFCTAGCKDLPAEWQAIADDFRRRYYRE